MLLDYQFTIKGYHVYLYVCGNGTVGVRINDLYEESCIPTRIGAVIIKRCRKVLIDWFKTADIKRLKCTPFIGDGNGEYRKKVFTWCGFRFNEKSFEWELYKPTNLDFVDINGNKIAN